MKAHCRTCNREVQLITREQATQILSLGEAGLISLALEGRIHTIRTVNGNFLYCGDSLFAK